MVCAFEFENSVCTSIVFRITDRKGRQQSASVFIAVMTPVGTGFTLAVFSLHDALLLKPLLVHGPNELVRLVQIRPDIDARSNTPFRFYELMQQNPKIFSNGIGSGNLSTAARDESGAVSGVRSAHGFRLRLYFFRM